MSAGGCRLYLIAPETPPDGFAAKLRAALQAGDVAALRVRDAAVAALALPITRSADVALILEGDPALAARLGCDGAHISDAEGVAAARCVLGDLQLGVFCGASRDAAMRAGEAGADYIAFDAAEIDLISWWAELMEVPVVAEGVADPAGAAALARVGADFVAAGDFIWSSSGGPGAAVSALATAIADP